MNTTDSPVAEPTSTITLFNVPVHALTMPQVLERVTAAIERRSPLHIGVVNAAKVVNMHRNPALNDDVLSSDLVLADGASVVMASRLLGSPLPERVTGIDLMYGMLAAGNSRGWRVYCLGATEEVSARVEACIRQQFPGVVIAGRRNGYFGANEEQGIAEQIAASRADILLVAITSPKKEQFMARWNKLMNVPVVHGVGGSFDVMAGVVRRAPVLWQRLGLEWLYRVLQEPGRLWKRYLVTNAWFCWLLGKAMVARCFVRSGSR